MSEENLPRPDWRKMPAEVAGHEPVDQVDDETDEQQPHGGEMPKESASQPNVVVNTLRAVPTAQADGQPDRKSESKQWVPDCRSASRCRSE